MSGKKELCVICAWRGSCQKKFSMKAGRRCPDFSKDLTIKEQSEEEKKEGG
jgi:hypothetical protein